MASLSHKQRVEPTLSGPLDAISLMAARSIENEFARHHPGGVTQRKAKIQCIVNDAIARAFRYATKNLTSALAEIPDAPPCMIESATVDTNNCCLRCGAADGEECRGNLMPVYAAREAE